MARKLARYFSNQMDGIRNFFEKAKDTVNDADIHELRLSLKKVRALLTLVNAVVPSFKLHNTLLPFELLFDQAARVREARLQYQMIPQLPATPVTRTCKTTARKTADREQQNLIRCCTAPTWKKLEATGKKVKSAIRKVSGKKALRFANKQQKKINKKLAQELTPSELHDFRKDLKNQHYYENMLGAKKRNTISQVLEELIGRWHDEVKLLEGLQKTKAMDGLPAKERNAHLRVLRALRERIQADLERIYKRQQRLLKKH